MDGLSQLHLNIAEVIRDLEVGGAEGERVAAARVAVRWRTIAPVDTGAYKASVRSDQDTAFSDIDYALAVEASSHTAWAARLSTEGQVADIVADRIRRRMG